MGAGAGLSIGSAVASLFVPGVGTIFAIGLGAAALLGIGGAMPAQAWEARLNMLQTLASPGTTHFSTMTC